MKTLSLLSSLSDNAKAAPVKETISEPSKRQYQVYLLDTKEGRTKLAVPVEVVESFDAFLAANPEALTNITEHLAQFEAVVVE